MDRGGWDLDPTWPPSACTVLASRGRGRLRSRRAWALGSETPPIPRFSGGGEVRRKVYLTFPQSLVREPILYVVGQKFKVVPNIRGASISEQIGFVALELTGEADEVDRAVQYFVDLGVKVEPITDSTPRG
jgi:NIL domain-containing protein